MQHHRTPAFWPTRILLVIGVLGTAAVVGFAVVAATSQPCFGCDDPDVLGIPASLVVAALATAPALLGLGMMIRTFRGERHDPPTWRYRER